MAFASSEPLPHDPGLFEITAGIILSISLGAILACLSLVSRPVETVRELPKDAVAGTIYYLPGNDAAQAGRQWMRKRQILAEKQPGQVAFIEDELNAWARAVFKDAAAKDDEKSSLPTVSTGTPNFRIRENQLQIAFDCELSYSGLSAKTVVQLRGEIEKVGDRFVFVPDDIWVGGLPAGRIAGLGDYIAGRLLSAQSVPEDVQAGWSALSYARVEGKQLVLKMP